MNVENEELRDRLVELLRNAVEAHPEFGVMLGMPKRDVGRMTAADAADGMDFGFSIADRE